MLQQNIGRRKALWGNILASLYYTGVLQTTMLLLLGILVFPVSLHADSGVVGFVERNIWHVPNNYQSGDTVRLYAALMNTTERDVSGTVRFYVNDSFIGSRSFTMRAEDPVGFAWYDWRATSGTNAFRAEIIGVSLGEGVGRPEVSTSSERITASTNVPVIENLIAASSSTTNASGSQASSSTATVAQTLERAGAAVDAAASQTRSSLTTLRDSIDTTIAARKEASKGLVLGTSTTAEDDSADSAVATTTNTSPLVRVFNGFITFLLGLLRIALSFFIGLLGHPIGIAVVILLGLLLVRIGLGALVGYMRRR